MGSPDGVEPSRVNLNMYMNHMGMSILTQWPRLGSSNKLPGDADALNSKNLCGQVRSREQVWLVCTPLPHLYLSFSVAPEESRTDTLTWFPLLCGLSHLVVLCFPSCVQCILSLCQAHPYHVPTPVMNGPEVFPLKQHCGNNRPYRRWLLGMQLRDFSSM